MTETMFYRFVCQQNADFDDEPIFVNAGQSAMPIRFGNDGRNIKPNEGTQGNLF
jgi:hypothetical protein